MARQTLILAKSITTANRYARLAGLQRFTYRAVRSAGSIRGVRSAEVHILPDFLERPDRHSILQELRYARSLDVYYVDPADFTEAEATGFTDDDRLAAQQGQLTNPLREGLTEENQRLRAQADIADDETVTAAVEAKVEHNHTMLAALKRLHTSPNELVKIVTDGEHETVESLNEAATKEIEESLDGQTGEAEQGEDPAPAEEPQPEERSESTPRRRRTRCRNCEELHFKDEPCELDDPLTAPSSRPIAQSAPGSVDFF